MNYVSIFRKEFKEKKVSGQIPLFHVKVQKPASRSPTLRAFVFLAEFAEFYYRKKFEKRPP